MSEGMNKVLLLGELGANPELRVTQGGLAVLKMRLATTEVYFDKDGVKQERTDWHRVAIFGKRGEALAKILVTGSRILVEGRLHTSSYEKDGVKHYSTEVIANDILFAGGKRPGDARRESAPVSSSTNGAALDIPF